MRRPPYSAIFCQVRRFHLSWQKHRKKCHLDTDIRHFVWKFLLSLSLSFFLFCFRLNSVNDNFRTGSEKLETRITTHYYTNTLHSRRHLSEKKKKKKKKMNNYLEKKYGRDPGACWLHQRFVAGTHNSVAVCLYNITNYILLHAVCRCVWRLFNLWVKKKRYNQQLITAG